MSGCEGRVWQGFRFLRCGNTVKVERDGKWYCGVHDPVAKKARDEKREKTLQLKRAAAEKNAVRLLDYATDGSTCTLMFKGELRRYREDK